MVLSVLGLSRGAGESLYYYSSHSSLLSFAVSVPVYVHFTQGYFPEQANVSFYTIVELSYLFHLQVSKWHRNLIGSLKFARFIRARQAHLIKQKFFLLLSVC